MKARMTLPQDSQVELSLSFGEALMLRTILSHRISFDGSPRNSCFPGDPQKYGDFSIRVWNALNQIMEVEE